MPELSVGLPKSDGDLSQFADILRLCFVRPADAMLEGIHSIGAEQVRLARVDGSLAGGLFRLDIGQWFGGRCVPCTGIAAVAVSPEYRGSGVAAALMRGSLEESKVAGVPISCLFPASVSLYRRFGYELAGAKFLSFLEPSKLPVHQTDLTVRPVADADHERLNEVHNEWSACRNGQLMRIPYNWRKILETYGTKSDGYVVCDGERILGHLFYQQDKTEDSHDQRIVIKDLAFTTPAAGAALVTFLASHRSLVRTAVMITGPSEPLLSTLDELSYSLKLDVYWMLRLQDPKSALALRGYPSGLRATLNFDLTDETMPANSGRFVLEVCDGHGLVTEGGSGDLRLNERSLAAMFSGHQSCRQLRTTGQLTCDASAAGFAEAVFGGPAPWMIDHF
jgi:predicted acetyltransferase